MNRNSIDVAVVGAGPYGLSVAAHVAATGVSYRIFGSPMHTWRSMPEGMLLRSPGFGSDLSDPDGTFSLGAFWAATGRPPASRLLEPIPLDTYLEYANWFMDKVGSPVEDVLVRRHLAVGPGLRPRARHRRTRTSRPRGTRRRSDALRVRSAGARRAPGDRLFAFGDRQRSGAVRGARRRHRRRWPVGTRGCGTAARSRRARAGGRARAPSSNGPTSRSRSNVPSSNGSVLPTEAVRGMVAAGRSRHLPLGFRRLPEPRRLHYIATTFGPRGAHTGSATASPAFRSPSAE